MDRHFGDSYFSLSYTYMDKKSLNHSYDYSSLGPRAMPNTWRRAFMFAGKYGWIVDGDHDYNANFYHQHQAYNSSISNRGMPYKDKTAFYILGDSKFNNFLSLNSKL